MAATKPLNTPLTAAEIATLCAGTQRGADFSALKISTDSRSLQAGDVVVTNKGVKH